MLNFKSVKFVTNFIKKSYKNDFTVELVSHDDVFFSIYGGSKENFQSILNNSTSFSCGYLILDFINNARLNLFKFNAISSRLSVVRNFCSILKIILMSVRYGWYLEYSIVGYNFSFKNSTRRRLLKLNLGLSRHRFTLTLPKSISVYQSGRRKLTMFSNNYFDMFFFSCFLHNIRNILPYKLRGMILEHSRLYVLKQGKKVKFR